MANSNIYRVFISSTYSDLKDYRQAVQAVVRQIGAIDISMEHFGARDECPTEECLRLIREDTDIFIGIYAHKYGFVPKDCDLSITEAEYNEATSLGIPKLIYILSDLAEWVPAMIDRGPAGDKLQALKEKLKANHICEFFFKKDDLATKVAADLGRFFREKYFEKSSEKDKRQRTWREDNVGKMNLGFAADSYLLELENAIRDSRVKDWYVPLKGHMDKQSLRNSGNAEDIVFAWLQKKERQRLAILGDYGTGKSWLCLRIAEHLLYNYKETCGDSPLPLLMTFKRYRSEMVFEDLVKECLADTYGVELENSLKLRKGLISGKIIPILDGLDEMARVLGNREALSAYLRLGIANEIPKVLITCRTHYFKSGTEQRELFYEGSGLLKLSRPDEFDILHIEMLKEEKIKECISRRFRQIDADRIMEFIQSTYNLPELCSRPVLLSLVCESYGVIADLSGEITSADLYQAYVDAWINREIRSGRLTIKPELVLRLFENIAEETWSVESLSISTENLFRIVDSMFSKHVTKVTRDEIERQVITSTFVRRSHLDYWQFVHRSFQEFFYARRFFQWEKETEGKGEFPVRHTPAWQFISQMVLKRWDLSKAEFWIKPMVRREKEYSLTKTTLRAAAAYWLIKKRVTQLVDYPFQNVMLDSVDLSDVDLADVDLRESDFHASEFNNANLRNANLKGSILAAAQFRGAILENVDFTGAIISLADFRGASLGVLLSEKWMAAVEKLKNCEGFDSANFDREVHDYACH